jgi:predicted HD superfamily hydrolase involved in NAD metabolism
MVQPEDIRMNNGTYATILAYLREELRPERVRHSIGVADLAADLCVRYAVPPDKGRVAGIGHDIAREYAEKRTITALKTFGLRAGEWDRAHPVVLHGMIGAEILKRRFSVRDRDILAAVRDHVLGRPRMGLLARILYVADFLEPGRGFLPEERRLAVIALPLDAALLRVTEAIFTYLREAEKSIAPVTKKMYDRMIMKTERRRRSGPRHP